MWHFCKFICSIFSKATETLDFIKCNIIQKLAYKSQKYISQVNGGLNIFFRNLRIRFEYYQNVTDPLIIPLIFIFLLCREKAHDNKEFSHENSKSCCESQIMTR